MENIGKKIGNKVRELRDGAGLSQPKLAEAADISLRGLQDLEYGQIKDPGVSTIMKLSKTLDTPLASLVGRNDLALKSDLIVTIIGNLTRLNESQLGTVLKLSDGLVRGSAPQETKPSRNLANKYK